MNKYLNIVNIAPVDGCDIISTIDVGMQDICEKALIDKLKEINANVGVAVLMEVQTGEVKAIVNMMKAGDGKYYEMRNNAISDMLEPAPPSRPPLSWWHWRTERSLPTQKSIQETAS